MVKKIIASIFLVCLVLSTTFIVNATAANFPIEHTPTNNVLEVTVGNVWATVTLIVQILSIACVIFLGLRYMMASADQRADIKKGLTLVVIGAIFVFCAATVAQFIVDAGREIIK